MKAVAAIKAYFEAEPHGRKISMDELRDLSKPERQELGEMCCEELGVEFEAAENQS